MMNSAPGCSHEVEPSLAYEPGLSLLEDLCLVLTEHQRQGENGDVFKSLAPACPRKGTQASAVLVGGVGGPPQSTHPSRSPWRWPGLGTPHLCFPSCNSMYYGASLLVLLRPPSLP